MTDTQNTAAAKDRKAKLDELEKSYMNTRKAISKLPGYNVDWTMIDRAWNVAKAAHQKQNRRSNDPYISHPYAVMEELAKLRCKTSILAAALLHDTLEDSDLTYQDIHGHFSQEIAMIVEACTAIKASEKESDLYFSSMSKDEQKAYLDTLTDAKLINSPYQREAFLVRFADRVHNLSTITSCPTGKRLEKVASTKEFLIPVASTLGMKYFEVVLSDLCMRYETEQLEDSESVPILEQRKQLTQVGGSIYSAFDQALQSALKNQTVFSFPAYNPFARLRGTNGEDGSEMQEATRRPLLAWELKKQLEHCHYFERKNLDLWEVILTYKDREPLNALAHFVDMFFQNMDGKGFYIQPLEPEDGCPVIRLSDQYDNHYRVVLVNSAQLEKYFIGDPKGERLTMIDEESPSDALRPKITIYSYTPEKGYREHKKRIPYGATALDFAFIINPAMALTAKNARIHTFVDRNTVLFTEDDYRFPLHTVLNEGDAVYFDADYHPKKLIDGQLIWDGQEDIHNVRIEWFSKVNTAHARNKLIHHFSAKFEHKEK